MLHWTSLSYRLAGIDVLQTIAVCGCFYGTEASSADVGVPLESTAHSEGGSAYGKRILTSFIRECLECKNMFCI